MKVKTFLRGNVFHNLCAEMCLAYPPGKSPYFPKGVNYTKVSLGV